MNDVVNNELVTVEEHETEALPIEHFILGEDETGTTVRIPLESFSQDATFSPEDVG